MYTLFTLHTQFIEFTQFVYISTVRLYSLTITSVRALATWPLLDDSPIHLVAAHLYHETGGPFMVSPTRRLKNWVQSTLVYIKLETYTPRREWDHLGRSVSSMMQGKRLRELRHRGSLNL